MSDTFFLYMKVKFVENFKFTGGIKMIEGKASLIIDLGNSETRVMTIFGTTETGEPISRLSVLPNKFAELTDKDERLLKSSDYNASNSKVFLVGDGSMFCSGYMCDREKGTASLRPSSSIKKYNSNISMYSVRLALLEGLCHIADITKSSIDLINVDWTVSVLLPPSDLELGATKMKEDILKIKDIKFVIPKVEKDINIENVRIYPEGFCAFIGEVFESRRKIRPGYESTLMSSTLVVDIGAGTTDLCIIKDAKLIDGSRYSEETGGNQVFQRMNMDLRKRYGRNFPEDSLREASVTGEIKVGATIIPVSDIIGVARKVVATKLSSAIRNYIESSDFSIYDIENILICGGGAEECGEGMKALGNFLKEDLEVWMSYSKFLEIPKVTKSVVRDGQVFLESEKISPRLLNIIGAGVLSEN